MPVAWRHTSTPRRQVIADGLDAVNTDVLMEQSVEFSGQLLRIERLIGVEVCRHATGVDSRVGTSGTNQGNLLAQQQGRQRCSSLCTVMPLGCICQP